MKTAIFCLLALGSLTGCISIKHRDFTQQSNLPKGATYKVVHPHSDDPMLTQVLQQLNLQGFRVIADNTLRYNQPVGMTTVVSADTAYDLTQFQAGNIELFREQPSDYVIYFDAALWGLALKPMYFNATVVNTRSGAVEHTYTFRQGIGWFRRSAGKVARDFALSMR
jgi:hypothetical protein